MAQNWTGKSLGNNFFQFLLRFFVKYGGRHIAYFICYFVVLAYTLHPSVLKKASFYLKRRFANRRGLSGLFIDAYKLNLTFAKILIDRAVFGIWGDIDIISSEQDRQLCKDLLAKGKGLIIITAHCGCWQTAMSAFDFMEGDKYVVYHKTKEDVDKHAHELSGGVSPVKFIESASFCGGAIEIMRALQNKGIVCFMGDRTYGAKNNSLAVDFLGAKIKVPYSPYRIAAAFETPVAVIFFPYKENGKVDSVIAKTFFVEDKGAKAKPVAYLKEAEKFIQSLQTFVEKYPYQFFNYYDLWTGDNND
ncbi:MAG: lysophospholipid acyltransferase family protein [Endomicrobium sp.]|jgi:predicted LPLAT superfamily acyltransferase|nr:lysophospholipid acyltransferase family protein [Endomicrobium sp.]